MRPTRNQIAVWVTVALTLAATVVRLATLPLVQAEAVGETGVSIWLLGGLLAAALVLAVFAFCSKLPLPALADGDTRAVGAAASAAGAVLFADTVMAMIRLILTGITPAPNAQILNPADRTTLWLTLVFGFLGGLWLVLAGIRLWKNQVLSQTERFGALLPVLWIWCRLARYELSYASATNAKRSFYDFAMLIFLTLFLLAFARYAANVAPPKARAMRAYASVAAMLGLSSPLTRLGMHLLGDTESFNASQLAGVTDFAIGLLALALTVYLYREEDDFDEEDESDFVDDLASPSETPLSDFLISEWMNESK